MNNCLCLYATSNHIPWNLPPTGTPIRCANIEVNGAPVTSDEAIMSYELSEKFGYDCLAIYTANAVYVLKKVIKP